MSNKSLLPTVELVATLERLREEGERFRAELYWNVQRLSRSRRRSVEMKQRSHQRRSMRVYRGDCLDAPLAVVRLNSPLANRDDCPPAKAS